MNIEGRKTRDECQRVYADRVLADVLVWFANRPGAIFSTSAVARERISAPDPQLNANWANSCASVIFKRRIRYLIWGTFGGATLSSSTPRPNSSAVIIGSPAISPQTPAQIPCLRAASTVILM